MFYNLALLLPCTGCIFWAVQLLCKWKTNFRSQNVLGLCALVSSFTLYVIADSLKGVADYSTYYGLDILDTYITLMAFPFMYLYFKSLTHESPFTKKDYLWFLPSLLLGTGTFILYEVMGKENAVVYIQSSLYSDPLAFDYQGSSYRFCYLVSLQLYNVILLLQGICVSVYAIINLYRYHRRLRDFYSVMDDKSLELNYTVLVCYLLSVLLPIIFMVIGGCNFWTQHKTWAELYFIIWCAVLYFSCYSGSQMKYTVENLAKDLESADREALENHYMLPDEDSVGEPDDSFKIGKYPQLLVVFNKLIDVDKIFLQSNLRMDELARLMHTNRTYISRMINEEFNCAFSDYINRKRIEYAKQLMYLSPEMKQQELAEKSGFLSASSFSKTFKQHTGMPPGEWMKSHIFES